MLGTVLVALDVNAEATPATQRLTEQVLQTLGQLQIQPQGKVVLIHVVKRDREALDIVVDRPQADLESFPLNQIEKQLQAYQKELICNSELEIVTGDPAEEIIRLSNIYKSDLILVGSRGLTGMQRILLGSVSSQIVADAPCSVMVVKPKA
jgi:nucleotide-binding universal stress UspA family protein